MTRVAPRTSDAHASKQVNRVTARLAQQFPDLTAEQIEHAVHGEFARFHDAAIRDYVPILVETHQPRETQEYCARGSYT
jgi:hypothetical protein